MVSYYWPSKGSHDAKTNQQCNNQQVLQIHSWQPAASMKWKSRKNDHCDDLAAGTREWPRSACQESPWTNLTQTRAGLPLGEHGQCPHKTIVWHFQMFSLHSYYSLTLWRMYTWAPFQNIKKTKNTLSEKLSYVSHWNWNFAKALRFKAAQPSPSKLTYS